MSDYIIYYTESNIVCIAIFFIILLHDLLHVNRRERQIKYDRALLSFIAYFCTDIVWAMIIDGLIPRTVTSVALANLVNFICLSAITHTWLEYSKAALHTPDRNKFINRFSFSLPFIVSIISMFVLFFVKRQTLIDENLMPTIVYYAFLAIVPSINIIASLVYSIKKARTEIHKNERNKYLAVGFFPLAVILLGVIQLLFLFRTPIFCFACAILMLTFHLKLMQSEISVDSLTGLNNRGALIHFMAQLDDPGRDLSNMFVVMMDINSFKLINDTYGHAEGDRALTIIAKSMKSVAKSRNMVLFLGRYGGDEFIMIVKAENVQDLDDLIAEMRTRINSDCDSNKTPYVISIGAGYELLANEDDSFRNCIQRADQKMYIDKQNFKNVGTDASRNGPEET